MFDIGGSDGDGEDAGTYLLTSAARKAEGLTGV